MGSVPTGSASTGPPRGTQRPRTSSSNARPRGPAAQRVRALRFPPSLGASPERSPAAEKSPRRGFQQPGLRLPRAFSASRAEPSRAGCGRLPAPLRRLPAGGERGKLREGGQRAGPMPASSRPALSAASFRGHLSSRNEPPVALPGPRPRIAGTRGGAAAAAVGAGPCALRLPPARPLPPSRARLPRPPSHSSSQ